MSESAVRRSPVGMFGFMIVAALAAAAVAHGLQQMALGAASPLVTGGVSAAAALAVMAIRRR